ncbi:hypothetical protein W97_07660 [Coniosporium apollinis CBS 100218]|uniref:Thioredoxin domain-containing protein n=1 Tax=Coniosporium apollinis (strain CBS 100218) TaxID=1168221 RepID=R7Z2N3_CONA1|nr:uncharacterized protein W97_07660 [Coniosporium apollinis CBS 100218]EON68450.1 hypothetical protein W97_07660 [Coniosporium apollinis CBS 100218]
MPRYPASGMRRKSWAATEANVPAPGKAFVGHRAPSFNACAVVDGNLEDVSLDYYLSKNKWLTILFIPAAFSFVCPTEVLAFNNCIDEFTDRGCSLAFVSTDSKHTLWQWQHTPRNQGGLGPVSVPLLSDSSHKMSRDYGVLLEDQGITINNLSVGRSVLETLRLVEAFKAAEEHGVLCPANWQKGGETLLESHEDQQERLDREFGTGVVKNLDQETAPKPSGNRVTIMSLRASTVSPSHGPTSAPMQSLSPTSRPTSAPIQFPSPTSLGQRRGHPKVLTLEFADPISANSLGSRNSPNDYIATPEGRSPTDTLPEDAQPSPSALVAAFKRLSGRDTPLGAPKDVMGHRRVDSANTKGYFG